EIWPATAVDATFWVNTFVTTGRKYKFGATVTRARANVTFVAGDGLVDQGPFAVVEKSTVAPVIAVLPRFQALTIAVTALLALVNPLEVPSSFCAAAIAAAST